MHIPKIIFRKMTLEENIDTIKWAYYENNGSLSVHDFTIGYFPELAVFDEKTPKEEVYNKIEEVVTKEYNFYLEKIKSETKRYNDIWEKYNDKYLTLLSDYLQVDLPKIEIIQGKVGLIPVFPRYLDEYSFSVSTELEEWFLIKSCAHETLHFMWFLKWKEIHPEIPRREYDSPYISWKYSEMVTDPVLNNKPFSNMFKDIFTERGYDSFYELKDKDNFVMDILRNIYSEDISIEEKINKGFNYIKRVLNTSETYIINAPESLKYITDNLDNILNKKIEQYKKIFQIENLEPIKINFFDDKQKFREFIYEIRGERESLPEYAVATFDNDMINAYIEKDIPKDSRKYKKTLFMATHELFHILYKNNILKNDYSKRIVWYDEGMAQFLSGEKDELFDEDNFRNFYLKVKEKTQIIPNLNELKHGITFNNNQYNGYDLSYLSIKYLNEILNEEDFIKLMGNFDKIKEYGNSIINDMFLYYDNIMEKTQRK